MKFILIFWMFAPGATFGSSGTAQFNDAKSCEVALEQLGQTFAPPNWSRDRRIGICVEKGSEISTVVPVPQASTIQPPPGIAW